MNTLSSKHLFFSFLLACCLASCQPSDPFAYERGTVSGFSELVNAGVKKIALSSPMSPAEMDKFYPLALKEAGKYKVEVFREKDLLITDLFPQDVVAGKEVLLLYQGNMKDAYLRLKADKKALVDAGKYEGKEREKIARRFGRMLSYTPQGINKLLAQQTDFRTMKDFGVQASNVFLYFKDLKGATDFYANTLGMEMIADYGMATIFRIAKDSYVILVDAEKGMHSADEPKTVALAILTDQLAEWWTYLQGKNVPIKYPYKSKEGGPHDGFVAIDPEGYLLEFETFKQHPENEDFIPVLDKAESIFPKSDYSQAPLNLGIKGAITWTYHKDLLAMQQFYEEVLGLTMVADQGWTKIYQVSETGFIGLVDERRGMHDFTEKKAVTLSFFLEDIDGWFDYVIQKKPFELRSQEMEIGPEEKYRAFVGYGPEGYFLEFDVFQAHEDNEKLSNYLAKKGSD